MPTYEGYIDEVRELPSPLEGGSQEAKASGALQVLRQLTKNAREVFRLLAALTADAAGREGATFNHLFDQSKRKFLVTSITGLKAHLREFTDHELVRTRKGKDGADLLYIPLERAHVDRLLAAMDQQ